MYIILLIFIILVIFNRRYIIRQLKDIDKSTWFILITILVFFLITYWFFVPTNHRIYGDEILLMLEAFENKGLKLTYRGFYESTPIITLYSIAFKLFGIHDIIPIKLNVIISIINLFLLFYLLQLLFNNKIISLLSPIFLAVTDFYMTQATSSYTHIISIMFALLSTIFFWLFLKYDKVPITILLVVTTFISSVNRVEYILLVPIFFFWWFINKKEKLNLTKKNIIYWTKNLSVWMMGLPFFIKFYLPSLKQKIVLYQHPVRVWKLGNIPKKIYLELMGFDKSTLLLLIIIATFIGISIYWLIKEKKVKQGLFMLSMSLAFSIIYYIVVSPQKYFTSFLGKQYMIPVFTYSSFLFATPIALIKLKNKYIKFIISLIILLLVLIIFKGPMNIMEEIERETIYTSYNLSNHYIEIPINNTILLFEDDIENIKIKNFRIINEPNPAFHFLNCNKICRLYPLIGYDYAKTSFYFSFEKNNKSFINHSYVISERSPIWAYLKEGQYILILNYSISHFSPFSIKALTINYSEPPIPIYITVLSNTKGKFVNRYIPFYIGNNIKAVFFEMEGYNNQKIMIKDISLIYMGKNNTSPKYFIG